MATTRTYYPMADGATEQWTLSSGSDSYALVDETGTPSFTDEIHCNTQNYITTFTCVGSSETYVAEKMIPWTSWNIAVYAKKGAGLDVTQIAGVLVYNGTTYATTAQTITSISGATKTFTWTTPPWSTTGKTNWGVAPNEVEFGIKYTTASSGPVVTVATVRLLCIHDDHSAATPDDPDDLRVKTGQDELDATTGSQNPTVNYPVPWDAAFNARMQYADMGGCYIEVGSSAAAHDLWQSALLQFGGEYGDEERSGDVRYAGSILQDAVQYYWRMKGVTVWGEETGWVSGGTFYGVTDSGTWSSDYHARANIRFGTSHSIVPVDYTVPVTLQTGYGKVTSTIGWTNEGIGMTGRHLAYYNGFSYLSFLGQDATSGTIMIYVQKYNHSTGTWGSVYELADTYSGSDTHFYPCILIGADHKLHLFIGGHGSQGVYYRTTNADDPGNGINITAWAGPTEIAALNDCTYIRPVITSAGTIFLFFRHTESASHGHYCFTRSTNNGTSWSDIQYVVYYSDYKTSPPSMYCGGVAIDANDRVHIVLSWWDNYGITNRGRAISCIYADLASSTYTTWYEFGTENPVGYTTTSRGVDNIQYANVTKIDTCGDPTTDPLTAPFVHTNNDGLVIDSNNYPHFVYFTYTANTGEETTIYYCYWSGSEWVITDLYTDESLPKLWKYRHGGAMYYDDGKIYIYGFVKPTGQVYFGGELYCYRRTIDTDSWNGYYLSANTGKGIGMIVSLPQRYPGRERELAFIRCNDTVWMEDKINTLVRYDGADVRIVEAYNTGSSITRTEIDRLPDAFGLAATTIQFPLKTAVAANTNAPTDRIYQIYYGNSAATSPPIDEELVFMFLENFENYDSGDDLNGSGGWTATASKFTISNSYDVSTCAWAHTNKLWDGDKFCFLNISNNTGYEATKDLNDAYPGMGADITDVDIYFHVWNESGTGILYVVLNDVTASKYVRVGLNCSNNQAGYKDYSGGWENVVACSLGRYYEFKVSISSSGVSATVNGTEIVTDDTEITVFDTIGIGVATYNSVCDGVYMIDGIRIVKRVATAPTITTNSTYAEVFFTEATGRMGNTVIPTVVALARAGSLVIPDKVVTARIADLIIGCATALARMGNIAIGDKVERARFANLITGDKTLTARLANFSITEYTNSARVMGIILGDKVARDRLMSLVLSEATVKARFGGITVPEMTAIGRVMNALIGDKALTDRMGNIAIPDKAVVERMTSAVLTDKEELARVGQIIVTNKIAMARIDNVVIPESTATERLADILIPDKVETDRIVGLVQVIAEAQARLAGVFLGDKAGVARFAASFIGDKEVLARCGGLTIPESEASARLSAAIIGSKTETERTANILQVIAEATARIAGLVLMEGPAEARMANLTTPQAEAAARLAALIIVQATATGRLAQAVIADAESSGRIANYLKAESTAAERIAQQIIAQAVGSGRIASIMIGSKTELARITQLAITEALTTTRFGNLIIGDKPATERITNALIGDKTVLARLANVILMAGESTARIANLVQAEMEADSRVANYLMAEKTGGARLANLLLAEKESFARMASAFLPEDTDIARLAGTILAESTTTARVVNLIITDKVSTAVIANVVMAEYQRTGRLANIAMFEGMNGLERLHNTLVTIVIPGIIRMLYMKIRGPEMADAKVTGPKIDQSRISGPYMDEATISRPQMGGCKVQRPRMEAVETNADGSPKWIR
ncbi:MAG: BNR-4 repeat-containing protein [Dehalococcoidia bacterium]|jgi:hypothetical protein